MGLEERKSDVAEAFELLLDALEEERKQTAEALSQIALTEGVQAAQQVLQRLKFLEQLKAETQRLYENWQNGQMAQSEFLSREQVLIEPERQDKDPTAELLHKLIVSRKPKRSFGGMPDSAFRPYILKALAELGGSARGVDVLERVWEMVRPHLSPIDLEWMPTGNDYRWRKKARWERFRMKQDGLLRADSPKGIWELSELGWREARKLIEGET
ncbi:MAG: winged helix-turn-helix domain-containing protein [Armatimonadota bacterium]